MNNLINTDINISPEKEKELLSMNVSKAKESDYYRKKGKEKDPFKLKLEYIRDNSLTIFNEYLISFENEMSDKYNKNEWR